MAIKKLLNGKIVEMTAREETEDRARRARSQIKVDACQAAEAQRKADLAAAIDVIPVLTDVQRDLLKQALGAVPEDPDEDLNSL